MDNEEVCEYCDGTGEVPCDEINSDRHIERGVGMQKCICQVKDEDGDSE